MSKVLNYDSVPFETECQAFKYLGVNVTSSFEALRAANFDHLLEHTKNDLERWSRLLISLAVQVNALKMTVLPRFLYLFVMVPV